MNEQEFLATLKLVSGEEVISMVLYLEDEDKVLLSNPFLVEQSKQRQGQLEVVGFSFKSGSWHLLMTCTLFLETTSLLSLRQKDL